MTHFKNRFDQNGRLRKPNGQFAKRPNAKRMTTEDYAMLKLTNWAKRQGIRVKVGK